MDETKYAGAFQIIMNAGNSKSAALMAIEAAKDGDFAEAEERDVYKRQPEGWVPTPQPSESARRPPASDPRPLRRYSRSRSHPGSGYPSVWPEAVPGSGRSVPRPQVPWDLSLIHISSCDLEIAGRVAAELGGIHRVITVDELEQEEIRNNPVDRCYLCKRHLFSMLKAFAEERGIDRILDGTNEDDMHVYRPGIRALRELGITSPLADLHITKAQVKELAAWYGISVASRPSTPCMRCV